MQNLICLCHYFCLLTKTTHMSVTYLHDCLAFRVKSGGCLVQKKKLWGPSQDSVATSWFFLFHLDVHGPRHSNYHQRPDQGSCYCDPLFLPSGQLGTTLAHVCIQLHRRTASWSRSLCPPCHDQYNDHHHVNNHDHQLVHHVQNFDQPDKGTRQKLLSGFCPLRRGTPPVR